MHRSELEQIMKGDFPKNVMEKFHRILKYLEKNDFIEIKYSKPNGNASDNDWMDVTAKGIEVSIYRGGIKSWEKDHRSIKDKEREKLDHELWLVKMSRKWFWIATLVGLVGGICGLVSLIYQIRG